MDSGEDEWQAPFSNPDCDLIATPIPYGDLHTVSPYVATPPAAVELLLSGLRLTAQDFLVDLGCGTGTINLMAARQTGTPGLGVDIEPGLVAAAARAGEAAGLAGLVQFRVEDVAEVELQRATAVTSFLVPRHLKLIREKLVSFLADGGRLACYHYPLQGVQPSSVLQLNSEIDKKIFIYSSQ